MPEHIRAYIVVLALAFIAFSMSKKTICNLSSYHNFDARRNAWLILTSVAFLVTNFWVYSAVAILVFFFTASRDANKLGLYYFLLFVLPPISVSIYGGGVFNYLISISHPRLLSICILVPLIFKMSGSIFRPKNKIDLFVMSYFVLSIYLNFRASLSFTDAIRYVLYDFIDIFIPYMVFSRYLGSFKQLNDVLLAYVTAAGVLSAIAIFEFLRGWLLYVAMMYSLGIDWGVNEYIGRAGNLRAIASTAQPIALGYVLTVAFGFWLVFKDNLLEKKTWYLGACLISAALIATLSRGPWLGLVVLMVVFITTGRRPITKLFQLSGFILAGSMVALLTSSGRNIIATLPFIGWEEQDNVSYRQDLFEAAYDVIMRNPLLGSSNYRESPEFLAISEGQVDVVNTYLSISLNSGMIGLFIFSMTFIFAIASLYKALQKLPDNELQNIKVLGRSLIAILVATLVILATVSPISFVPIVYWSLLGLSTAYLRLVNKTENVN